LDVDIRIKGNKFRNNHAKQGGAIYVKDKDLMKHIQLIEDNEFTGNLADIGGSIFSENLVERDDSDRQSMTTHLSRNVFNENRAFNNSKNTFSHFSKLVLDMNNSMNDP
jgi:predicted outer membrane repeat protein